MAGTVAVDYRVGGVDAVVRSFTTITQAATRAAKQGAAEQVRAATQRANGEKKASTDVVKASNEATQAMVRHARFLATEREKAAREAANAQKKSAKEASDFQRAQDSASAANFRRTVREREAVARDERRRGEAETRASARVRASTRSTLADATKRGVGNGFGVIGSAAALVSGAVGIATVEDAGRSQLDLGRRAALLQNSSGRKLDFVRMAKDVSNVTGDDAGDVLGGLEKISGKAGGAGIDEVQGHFLELAKNAKAAGVEMGDLGDVTATLINRGVRGKDLVHTVQALVQQGKDGAVEFKDLASMLDASSGALGKFKMNTGDRITTAGGLSQLARTYGKKSAEEATNSVEDIARDLGGKADIVQRLTGGSATTVHDKGHKTRKMVDGHLVETTEGASTKTVYSGGVEVGTDSTRAQLRDINDVLPDLIAGAFAHGNAGKLMGEGGVFTGNSTAIAGPLIQAFSQGIAKNGAGRFEIVADGQKAEISGRAAIVAMLKQSEAATVDEAQAHRDFENVMKTGGVQVQVAFARLKNDLGDKLGPQIAKLTPAIVSAVSAFGNITAAAIEHPFLAAGAIVTASLAKSFAGVGVDKLIDKLFAKVVPEMSVAAGVVNVTGSGLTPPGGMPAPVGGIGGTAGKLGLGGAAAIAGTALAAGAVVGGIGYAVAKTLDDKASEKGGYYDKSAKAADTRPRDPKTGALLSTQPDAGALAAFQRDIGAVPGVATTSAGALAFLGQGNGGRGAANQVGGVDGTGATPKGADGKPIKVDGGTLEVSNLGPLIDAQNAGADRIVAALAARDLQGPKVQR